MWTKLEEPPATIETNIKMSVAALNYPFLWSIYGNSNIIGKVNLKKKIFDKIEASVKCNASWRELRANADNRFLYFMEKSKLLCFDITNNSINTITEGIKCYDIGTKDEIAVGDYAGKIRMIFKESNNSALSHWHSGNVNSVKFINGLNSLLSGGEEVCF